MLLLLKAIKSTINYQTQVVNNIEKEIISHKNLNVRYRIKEDLAV